ncbi:MAG TPA: hypothetical protein DCZ40_08070 [Lachnospiraceae bacterium]|nr:hypothetical protein [Lachnospiraceae bacterium]
MGKRRICQPPDWLFFCKILDGMFLNKITQKTASGGCRTSERAGGTCRTELTANLPLSNLSSLYILIIAAAK